MKLCFFLVSEHAQKWKPANADMIKDGKKKNHSCNVAFLYFENSITCSLLNTTNCANNEYEETLTKLPFRFYYFLTIKKQLLSN